MNILEIAITAEGSVNALAKSIGVRQNVISNWRAREAIPAGWMQLLKLKYECHKHPPKPAIQRPAAEKGVSHG